MSKHASSIDLQAFSQDGETAWNSHDVDRILARYHPGIVFRSRNTINLVGKGTSVGVAAHRNYWVKALER